MKRRKRAAETSTCPSCLTVNSRFDAFCLKCGSALGAVATIDPIQSIRAEAFALNKAIEGPPRLSVLFVVGIPTALVLIVSVTMAVKTLLSERGTVGFIYFWMMIAAATLAFMILHRVAKNYFTKRKKN